jgi:uncharacterized protein (TIGR00106 family)
MRLVLDFSVIPIGVGTSLSPYVAACQRVLEESGLTYRLHAYGTNVEGEWDDVMAAVKRCHEVVHAMGAPRISTSVRMGTRTDRETTLDEKVESVRRRLASTDPD